MCLFHVSRFTASDLERFCVVISNCVSIPVHGEAGAYIIPNFTDLALTPLQDTVLHAIDLILAVSSKNVLIFTLRIL